MKKVLILDFGGQYNLLVARRVRECGIYCEIKPYSMSMADIRAFGPAAIIFTGGPATVFEEGAPRLDPEIFALGLPILGICYGQQLMIQELGGSCRKAGVREYGKVELTHSGESALFFGIEPTSVCWMSHGVEVETIAPGFRAIAHTKSCTYAAIEDSTRKLYGVQFHPEVLHTVRGTEILKNFLYRICGLKREWTMANYASEAIDECRAKIGSGKVLLALSGGVDSAVAAALLYRAVGDQLTCIFVDHGLLRKNEGDDVERAMKDTLGMNIVRVDARERFLSKLSGVTEPESKRKIIGEEFIRVFEAEAKKSARSTSSLRARSIPMWWSPAWAARAMSSRVTTMSAVFLIVSISRRSSSRCAVCSRTRCASSVWSLVFPKRWSGVNPSPAPVLPFA